MLDTISLTNAQSISRFPKQNPQCFANQPQSNFPESVNATKVKDAAKRKSGFAKSMADRFKQSAEMSGDVEAKVRADIFERATSDDNYFVAKDLLNKETGELYDGRGVLVMHTSRLNLAYVEKMASRTRKRIFERFTEYQPESWEKLWFVSLTVPMFRTIAGNYLPFDLALRLLNRALELLRKRQYFTDIFKAGVTSRETTIGAKSHYHLHAHLLGWCDMPNWKTDETNWQELGEQWTDCLRVAADETNVKFEIPTEHGRAVVDIRRRIIGNDDELKEAILEGCKYLAKGSDLAEVPVGELVAIEQTLRGCRMVETFGGLNKRKGSKKREENKSEELNEVSPILYLDKENTIDGKTTSAEKPARKSKLQRLGEFWLGQGRPDIWQSILDDEFRRRREFRMRQLAEKFPEATFQTLSGEHFSLQSFVLVSPTGGRASNRVNNQ